MRLPQAEGQVEDNEPIHGLLKADQGGLVVIMKMPAIVTRSGICADLITAVEVLAGQLK